MLRKAKFTLDGTKYKWMTLEEMEEDSQIRDNNEDVLREFEKYIFNTERNLSDEDTLIPKKIYIRLNRVCNLACSFCLADKKSPEFPTEQVKKVLDDLKSHGSERVKLTGGEPTLHSGFFEIVKHSIELGLDTVVCSNLCVSEDVLNKLINYSVTVSTSIHGDEEFHDSVTQQGAYKKTYENICKLIQAHIPVTIHMVVMNKNFDLAENVIKSAIRAGVEKVVFQTLIPRGRGVELFDNSENKKIFGKD